MRIHTFIVCSHFCVYECTCVCVCICAHLKKKKGNLGKGILSLDKQSEAASLMLMYLPACSSLHLYSLSSYNWCSRHQSSTSRNQLNHTYNVLSASTLSEPPLLPMGESDTLPVSAEVIPPSPSSHSEEHRVSTTEEFTRSETIPKHPHLYHAVPKEPPHHSGVDHHHHHHSINSEFILHPPTHVHHHTSQVENGEKHSESRKSDSGGKAHPQL